MREKKFKYQINFLRNTNETLVLVKRKVIKNLKTFLVSIDENKTFNIDFKNAAYMSNYVYYYFVDIESGHQYQFTEILSKIDAKSLDLLFRTNIIKQITHSLTENKKIDYFTIITSIVMGIAIGGMIIYAIMQKKIDELLNLIIELQNSTPPLPF